MGAAGQPVVSRRPEGPAGEGFLEGLGQRRLPVEKLHAGDTPPGVDVDVEGSLTLRGQ
jgi:hypothetical protein